MLDTFRRARRAIAAVGKWWRHRQRLRQLPRTQVEIIREIDRARAQHRSTHQLHRQLQAHVHKEMQS